jgi:hypothetical protein
MYLDALLVIAVDGVPLDQLVHTAFPNEFPEGLHPTLLDWNPHGNDSSFAWGRILPKRGATAIAPLLMCPDDGLGCMDLVAEVIAEAEVIQWNRLGRDMSAWKTVEDLGTKVEWLPGIGPYLFRRAEYERCIEVFRREMEAGDPCWGLFLSPTVYKSRVSFRF